jgi:hypothetical protein
MYPRQSPSTHTEQLGDEVAVYDRARTQVHPATRPRRACGGSVTVLRAPPRSLRPCTWRWGSPRPKRSST